MKVKDSSEVVSTPPTGPKVPAPTKAGTTDRVSVEQSRELQAAVSAAQARSAHTRAARLQDLASAVKRGSYRPDPNQIAQRILDSAELEARLRAILWP